MNYIKEQDIVDKSRLALVSSHRDLITVKDLPNNNTFIDGVFEINSVHFPYIVMANPSIGKIEKTLRTFIDNPYISNTKHVLFIIEYASSELVNFFRQKNIFYLDSAGNCFINPPQLMISVEGKDKVDIEPFRAKRSFQKTGLKLIFELFNNPDLVNKSYREISTKTNISLASVGYVFEELKDDGYIIALNEHKRILNNLKRLVIKWANSYYDILRPLVHRGYFSVLNGDNLIDKFQINNNDQLFFGGEYGVYYLNGFLKPKDLIMYTNLRLSTLAKSYRIVPVGKHQENVIKIEILEKFWLSENNNTFQENLDKKINIVNPILIYADLINSNNYRCVEAADEILENEIRDQFIRHKLQW